MTLPEKNTQIYVGKYEKVLPGKEALKKLIDEQFKESGSADGTL